MNDTSLVVGALNRSSLGQNLSRSASSASMKRSGSTGSLSSSGSQRDIQNLTGAASNKPKKKQILEAESGDLAKSLAKEYLKTKLEGKVKNEFKVLKAQVTNESLPAYDDEKFKDDLQKGIKSLFDKYETHLYQALAKMPATKDLNKNDLNALVRKTLLEQVNDIIEKEDIPLIPNDAEKEIWSYLREVAAAVADPVQVLKTHPKTWRGRSVKSVAGAAIGWGLAVRYSSFIRAALPEQILALDRALGGYGIHAGMAVAGGTAVFLYEWVITCVQQQRDGAVPFGAIRV